MSLLEIGLSDMLHLSKFLIHTVKFKPELRLPCHLVAAAAHAFPHQGLRVVVLLTLGTRGPGPIVDL